MKYVLLLLVVCTGSFANGQSLKDALYGGKLKLDTGVVIRKGDDLKQHMDTGTKKPAPIAKSADQFPAPQDSLMRQVAIQKANGGQQSQERAVIENDNKDTVAATGGNAPVSVTADNNKVWKSYVDELMASIRTEVLPSKKIKNGTYYVLVEYEIDVDGQIAVKNVSSSPGNEFLEEQVRERINLTAPKMTPQLNNYGKPRKVLKKQNLTIVK